MKKIIFCITLLTVFFLTIPAHAQTPNPSVGDMVTDLFSSIWGYIKANPATFSFILVAYEGVVRWIASEKTYSIITWIYKIFKFIQNFLPDVKAKALNGTITETHL